MHRTLSGVPLLLVVRAVLSICVILPALAGASIGPVDPVQVLKNVDPEPDADAPDFDNFGTSVAVAGSTIVVGASIDSVEGGGSGRVYVYDLGNATPGVPVQVLKNVDPEPDADAPFGDWFGVSVAVTGSTVVVGANNDDVEGANAGRVYVYDLAGATPGVPVQVLKNADPELDADAAAGDLFGTSVAVAGSRIIVGASGDSVEGSNAGRVYVYDLASATPGVPVQVLKNADPELDADAAAGDLFGESVALAGSMVVVGASGDSVEGSNAGRVYVYDLASATPGVPVQVLKNTDPELDADDPAGDRFGTAVAIAGTTVIVGASGDGVEAGDAGRVYVYDLASATPGVPVQVLKNADPELDADDPVGDLFGASVAVTGNTVIVGASNDDVEGSNAGRVYIYDLASATPGVPEQVVKNVDAELDADNPAGDLFGTSVAVAGSTVVVGARSDSVEGFNTGRAYVYGSSLLAGDINGDGRLDLQDLYLLERHVLGQIVLSPAELARGDLYPMGGDGQLQLSDWLALQQLLAN